jgi:predicted component of type VI protein secretion system
MYERAAEQPLVFRFPRSRSASHHPIARVTPLRLCMQPGAICIELTESDLLLGRHSSADVRLSLPDISRRHCRFSFADGQWEVTDLNSLNGIHINGERLQKSVLCHGDTLSLGGLTFTVELPGAGLRVVADERETSAAVIQRIADVLPQPADVTQEFRKAS